MASLNERTGTLGRRLASHLLRRCTFNVTFARIDSFANMTAGQAVDELFNVPALRFPSGPLSWHDGTPIHKVPATEANLGYDNDLFDDGDLQRATQLWLFYECLYDPSIRMKLTYWYHSLFVTSFLDQWGYYYWSLCMQMTTGSLKTFAYKMTLDNQMLRYLDNRNNNKGNPNENYAREFFELFTILKGPQVETGNYTNYTEEDIGVASRVLTGFKQSETRIDPETNLPTGRADFNQHDTDSKTFTAAFGNTTITPATSENDMFRELQDFVDMVYNQPETARAFVRRLYRYFVSDNISPEIESDVIEVLSTQLRNDNFIVTPTIMRLLKSEHFFDSDDSDSSDEIVGGKVKSPMEVYITAINLWEANNLNLAANNANYENIFKDDHRFLSDFMDEMGMDPEGPPTVEGYSGYYKEPGFSNNWFDTSTSYYRYAVGESLRRGKVRSSNRDIPFQVDMVTFVTNNISNPADANVVVTEILSYLFADAPATDRYNYFLDKLLGGLSLANWTDTWNSYVGNGDDTDVRIGLNNLFTAIMQGAEFQTF